MSTRRATPDDAVAIAYVHVRAWQTAYRGLLPDALLDGLSIVRRQEVWTRTLTDAAQAVWVYPAEGGVVAFASLEPCRDPDKDAAVVAELTTLYALPEVWGKGVGRALWLAALDHLTESVYHEITLWVLTENVRARRFYALAGFRPDGHTQTEVRGDGLTLHETRYIRAIPEVA